jgi:purine-binding chemotaxis protein CheW
VYPDEQMEGALGDRPARWLVCRTGSRLCALQLQHVTETMRPLAHELVPGLPPFVLGLSVIRGSPTPVVDAARLLGETSAAEGGRWVTIRVGGRAVALAVDAVVGIRSLGPAAVVGLPPLLRDDATEVVDALGTLDAELLVLLRSARIVPPSVWAVLDAGPERP